MPGRTDAVWRVVALLWAWTVGGLLAAVVLTLGLIVGVVDIILQLILGTDAISRDGYLMHAIAESIAWWMDLHVYAFTGKGHGFEWIPSLDR